MREPRPHPVNVIRRADGAAPCHCGCPIPAGRTAYCSARCRLADMDHGSDCEPTEGAA